MSGSQAAIAPLAKLEFPLERDDFLRDLLRELSGLLEEVVGLEEASGFISVVGQNIGRDIDRRYRRSLQIERLDQRQVADVLVDLKRRIQGDFYIVEQDEDKIVLGNRACPFGDKVLGRPAMCMMTSNVFGAITADNLGYAKVDLQATIAEGATQCRVVVHVRPSDEAERTRGREYFSSRH